jgi:predicted DNA-binding transcriptional regulator YafY
MDTGALADAIRSHRAVELLYDGDVTTRIVHPHALYRTAAGLCLDAVQVAGHTTSGELPAWKRFRLMKIARLRVLEARFDTAPDFDPASDTYSLGLIVSA